MYHVPYVPFVYAGNADSLMPLMSTFGASRTAGGMTGLGPSTDFRSVFRCATTSSDFAPKALPCQFISSAIPGNP